MTFLEIKNHTAAMLSRTVADFTLNGVSSLDRVINHAIQRAQRLVDFELAKKRGFLPLVDGKADYLEDMLDSSGGSAVTPKKLVSISLDEQMYQAVRLRGEREFERLGGSMGVYAYFVGSMLYLENGENSSGLYTVYLQHLPELVGNSDTNFLLKYCSDWVITQATFELQYYLKEDERVQLTAGLLRDKWDTVVAWNASLQSEQDLSLD